MTAENPIRTGLTEWWKHYRVMKGLLPGSRREAIGPMYSHERNLKSRRGMQDNVTYVVDQTAFTLFRLGPLATIIPTPATSTVSDGRAVVEHTIRLPWGMRQWTYTLRRSVVTLE